MGLRAHTLIYMCAFIEVSSKNLISYTSLFHDNDTLLVEVVCRGGQMRDRPTFKNLHPYCENSNDVPENYANRSKTI